MPMLGVAVAFLRYRGECPTPGPLLAPRGRDEPHAVRALHCAHYVDAPGDRPPARPGLLHEAEALEPQPLLERRRIAAELAAVQLEAEHAQPVPQAKQADEFQVPWRHAPRAREHLPH